MRIRCDYCGGYLEDTDVNCPNCNAPNAQLKRSADGIPKTIEELKRFAAEKGIPLSQMRFFIGYDMREPRAYGIYKDAEGNFVVYKNKSNGERAVRYKGSDEAYAVNEIYQKLRTEMAEQKIHRAETLNQTYQPNRNNTNKISKFLPLIICVGVVVLVSMFCVSAVFISLIRNFSRYGSSSYYNYDYDSGYEYDYEYDYDYDSGYENDYENDYDYDYDSGYDNNYDSGYDYSYEYDYDSYDDWDYDWDDDDWDYDYDWDSGYSDWDSDW